MEDANDLEVSVADSEAETGRIVALQLLDVAGIGGHVAGQTVGQAHGGLAIDGSNVGACLVREYDPLSHPQRLLVSDGRGVRAILSKSSMVRPKSARTVSSGTPPFRWRDSRAAATAWRSCFVSGSSSMGMDRGLGSAIASSRPQTADSGELFRRKPVEKRVGFFPFVGEIESHGYFLRYWISGRNVDSAWPCQIRIQEPATVLHHCLEIPRAAGRQHVEQGGGPPAVGGDDQMQWFLFANSG